MQESQLFNLIKDTDYETTGKKTDFKVYVDDNNKIVFLLFEESNGRLDWFFNLYFFKTMYKNKLMKCHRGFAIAYKAAKDVIMSKLLEACKNHPDYRVVISGWSHGGALAVLAAEDFNYRTRTCADDPDTGFKPLLITYGAPKVAYGNKTVEYIRKCIHIESEQICNRLDIVTKLPPFSFFKHICKRAIKIVTFSNMWRLFNPWTEHTTYDKILIDTKLDYTV